MPRRKIKLDDKITAMREALRLVDAADIARKHKLSRSALYKWYREVLEALPVILINDKPGRRPLAASKPAAEIKSAPPF
jgi:transposase-like protein